MIDDAYKDLSDKAFRIFAFYNVFELYNERLSEKVARRLIPDVIINVQTVSEKFKTHKKKYY